MTKHEIGGKNYETIVNVWKTFEMKNMKNHHDSYLKCDVVLLALKVLKPNP